MPSLPTKWKGLLILAENSSKKETKLFPLCALSHENENYSQVFYKLLSLESFFWFWFATDSFKLDFLEIPVNSKAFHTVLTLN